MPDKRASGERSGGGLPLDETYLLVQLFPAGEEAVSCQLVSVGATRSELSANTADVVDLEI